VLHQRTSRLSGEELHELVARVGALLPRPWDRPTGRKRALSLVYAVEATVIYLRRNHVQEVIGEFYDVSQPTISRVISLLTPLVRAATAGELPTKEQVAARIAGRVVLLDGALAPVWSWAGHRELWAGKHRTTGLNFQVVTDAFGQVITISEPIGDRTHDMRALAQSGLKELLPLADAVFADKGYKGSGYFTPRKKPAGGELTDTQKRYNAQISAIRAPVERAIANIKAWRILHTDYRRPLQTFQNIFHAVVGLYWFKLNRRYA
jgi:DDE superfamily endonuclease